MGEEARPTEEVLTAWRRAEVLWREDPATIGQKGHEGLYSAWRRLFPGVDEQSYVGVWDGQGGDLLLYPGGVLVFAGAVGKKEIRRVCDEDLRLLPAAGDRDASRG
jgi:hypothetical protein